MYRPKLVPEPVTTWREFYDLAKGKYSGKVVVVDSMGDVFPFPLKMLGYSVNDNDPAHLKEAGDILLDLAPHVLALDSENYDDKLGDRGGGTCALAGRAGSNDLRANPDTADAVYLNPKEGGLYWMDVWVMLEDAAPSRTPPTPG